MDSRISKREMDQGHEGNPPINLGLKICIADLNCLDRASLNVIEALSSVARPQPVSTGPLWR